MKVLALVLLVCVGTSHADSVVPAYGETQSERHAQVQKNLKSVRAVERMASSLSYGLSLPQPITLMTTECGTANAFYDPRQRTIILCLELLVRAMTAATQISDEVNRDRRERVAAGAVSFVLLHELGHALIQVLDLPLLGREEDAADQLSAYLLLNGPASDAQFAMRGAMWFFADTATTFTQRQLSGEHSLDSQRRGNLACWAIGMNSSAYAWARREGRLTPQREARCPSEYRQLASAVRRLLAQNLTLATPTPHSVDSE